MDTDMQSVLHRHHRVIAEIVATVKSLPEEDRLDALAIASRALLDSHLLDGWRRTPVGDLMAPLKLRITLVPPVRCGAASLERAREARAAPPTTQEPTAKDGR